MTITWRRFNRVTVKDGTVDVLLLIETGTAFRVLLGTNRIGEYAAHSEADAAYNAAFAALMAERGSKR